MFATSKPPRKRRFSAVSTSSEPVSDQTVKKFNHLMTSNHKLFMTGNYSDFTVFCGGREFRLHRSIVCPQSSFFATALDGSFVEAGNKVIRLLEDDPVVVMRMIQFLYTSEYDETTQITVKQDNEDGPKNDLMTQAEAYEHLACHVQLYAAADKYDIEDLKYLAKSKLEMSISGRWPIPFFPVLVQGILNSTPPKDRGLREIITPICAEHIAELLSTETAVSNPLDPDSSTVDDIRDEITFNDTLSENGAFTSAVLAQVALNGSKKLMEAEVAYAGLSQEFVTYKEKAAKEIDGLKAKLQQARKELNDSQPDPTLKKQKSGLRDLVTAAVHQSRTRSTLSLFQSLRIRATR
ncbi:MAG: hypothetical protein Q9195_009499 [Heterodermia aff. obscurata]